MDGSLVRNYLRPVCVRVFVYAYLLKIVIHAWKCFQFLSAYVCQHVLARVLLSSLPYSLCLYILSFNLGNNNGLNHSECLFICLI